MTLTPCEQDCLEYLTAAALWNNSEYDCTPEDYRYNYCNPAYDGPHWHNIRTTAQYRAAKAGLVKKGLIQNRGPEGLFLI